MRRDRLHLLVAAALYLALAIASTWPLVAQLGQVVPGGTENADTVPLASSWALWWTADRIPHGLIGLWDAPIMWPAAGTFAYSEPMLLLGAAAAPVIWLGGSPALAHGLVVLACLLLNGLAVRALARRLGAGDLASLLGGAIGVLLPYVQFHLGVLTLVPIFPLVWTVHALIALADDPHPRRGLLLGAAFASAYLTCAQHALFLLLAAAPAVALLARRAVLRRQLAAVAIAGAVAAVAVTPFAVAQHRAIAAHQFERSSERIRQGAASPASYVRAPFEPLVPLPPLPTDRREASLFPGAWKLALAIVGLAWAWRRERGGRAVRFLAALAGAALLISLAPRIVPLWDAVRAVIPGLDQIRSVYRAAVIVQLVIAVAAGLGLAAVLAWAGSRGGRRAAAAALALLSVIELWPRDMRMTAPPDAGAWSRVNGWIDANLPAGAPIVNLPYPSGPSVEALAPAARQMYLATVHRHPIANGYSSYWPASYFAVRRAFTDALARRPGADSAATGIHFAVVNLRRLAARGQIVPPGWRLRYRDASLPVAVYQIGD